MIRVTSSITCSDINLSNFRYHCLGACFKPYKLFFNLHTSFSFRFTSYPYGCCIYISSSKSPWRKAVFTSNCSRCKSSAATRLKIVLIEVILTTGENMSTKSIPFFCANPFTTSLRSDNGGEYCSKEFDRYCL